MTQQSDPPSTTPIWLLPTIIVGAILVVAGLVTFTLTMRDLPDTTTTITADAMLLPTGHPTPNPAATLDTTALPSAHSGIDPNGPPVETMSLADARTLLDAGQAVFIDLRPGAEYTAGHIAGALTITAADLYAQIDAHPTGTRIITYGDATRADTAERGAQIFMDLGYSNVIALRGGFQDWLQAGHPVEP